VSETQGWIVIALLSMWMLTSAVDDLINRKRQK
jgi:hypothetical protein